MKLVGYALCGAMMCGLAGAAQAGGLDDPIIDGDIIAQQTVSSGHDILVPLVALILIATAASLGD